MENERKVASVYYFYTTYSFLFHKIGLVLFFLDDTLMNYEVLGGSNISCPANHFLPIHRTYFQAISCHVLSNVRVHHIALLLFSLLHRLYLRKLSQECVQLQRARRGLRARLGRPPPMDGQVLDKAGSSIWEAVRRKRRERASEAPRERPAEAPRASEEEQEQEQEVEARPPPKRVYRAKAKASKQKTPQQQQPPKRSNKKSQLTPDEEDDELPTPPRVPVKKRGKRK